jgi:hypothetical protein
MANFPIFLIYYINESLSAGHITGQRYVTMNISKKTKEVNVLFHACFVVALA